MIARCGERRQAVSAAVAVSAMPRRTQPAHGDPTDCIVCTAHTVCCMALCGILAELWLKCSLWIS